MKEEGRMKEMTEEKNGNRISHEQTQRETKKKIVQRDPSSLVEI